MGLLLKSFIDQGNDIEILSNMLVNLDVMGNNSHVGQCYEFILFCMFFLKSLKLQFSHV